MCVLVEHVKRNFGHLKYPTRVLREYGRTDRNSPISHPGISRCDKNQHHFLDKLYPIVKFVCFVGLARTNYGRGFGRIPDKRP